MDRVCNGELSITNCTDNVELAPKFGTILKYRSSRIKNKLEAPDCK